MSPCFPADSNYFSMTPTMVVMLSIVLLSIGVATVTVEASDSWQSQNGRHVYTDSFPPNAEYDASILDPYHMYGAPYGGFSRATKSRLAALPLYLPDISEEALLDVNNEGGADADTNLYFEVRDDTGRPFACRVYHEDELEPDSLNESMFDAPRLRSISTATTTAANGTDLEASSSAPESSSSQTLNEPERIRSLDSDVPSSAKRVMAEASKTNRPSASTAAENVVREDKKREKHSDAASSAVVGANEEKIAKGSSGSTSSSSSNIDNGFPSNGPKKAEIGSGEMADTGRSGAAVSQEATIDASGDVSMAAEPLYPTVVKDALDTIHKSAKQAPNALYPTMVKDALHTRLQVEDRLVELESICGQIHKGYWSYEWCYEASVTQFHIEYDTKKNELLVDGITDLGTYASRSVFVDVESLPPNNLLDDDDDDDDSSTVELARVLDMHEGGGMCEESGNLRQTYVHLQCCSSKAIAEHQGLIHRHGTQVAGHVLAVVDVQEDPALVCSYNITVCTPLLCKDSSSDSSSDSSEPSSALSRLGETSLATSSLSESDEYANESIRELLDAALTGSCLQTLPGGWWTYEMCYKQSVRQFHQVTAVIRDGATVKIKNSHIESEHVLGKFNVGLDEALSSIDDYKAVVNATGRIAAVMGSGGSSGSAGDASAWGEGSSGAYFEVEYTSGDVCDHSDVTDAAIVAGSRVFGERGAVVERATSVRFYCGAMHDIAVHEDSTCHYVVKVKVPALCKHPLFKAPVFKRQVMKCLPVKDEY